jgi:hypothetical protein
MLSRLRFAFLKTRPNEAASAIRLRGLKRLSESEASVALLSVVLVPESLRCYGVRRTRPLARRRLITSRPAFVAIRALNPWVRARFNLLG